jgi:hypothetical protein
MMVATYFFFFLSVAICAATEHLRGREGSPHRHNHDHFFDNSHLCFLSASSQDHYSELEGHIVTLQQLYPCNSLYVYDLGLNKWQLNELHKMSFVKVLKLNTTRPFVFNYAKIFKAIAMKNFIDMYPSHKCPLFFYGDSSIRFHSVFNQSVFNEAKRLGIVTSRNVSQPEPYQIKYTHPNMYKFFNVDRDAEWEYELRTKDFHIQIPSGLMMIDPLNETMKRMFFNRWAACAEIDECIHNGSQTGAGMRVRRERQYLLKNGQAIYRYVAVRFARLDFF